MSHQTAESSCTFCKELFIMTLFSLVLQYSGHTQVIFISFILGGGGVVYRSLLAEVFGVRKWTALKRFNYSHSDTLFFQRTLASVHIFFSWAPLSQYLLHIRKSKSEYRKFICSDTDVSLITLTYFLIYVCMYVCTHACMCLCVVWTERKRKIDIQSWLIPTDSNKLTNTA